MNKYQILMTDTDGVALGVSSKDGENNKQQIIDKVKELETKWQKELNFKDFELDIEEFEFQLHVGHKNYIIGKLTSQKDIKTKGVLFKAQNKSKLGLKTLKSVVFDSLKDIGDWQLEDKELERAKLRNNIINYTNEAIEKIDIKKVDIKDLTMNEAVNPVSSYKKDDSIQAVRTKAIERLTNIKITHSSKFLMLVCIEALPGIDKISPKKKKALHYMYPLDYVTNDMIDFDWYKNNVRDYIFSAFGINKKVTSKAKSKKVIDKNQKSIFDY